MSIDELKNGEFRYLSKYDLEQLLEDLEDALIDIKRELRNRSKYG